jgi:hypothetical protein
MIVYHTQRYIVSTVETASLNDKINKYDNILF